MNNPFDDYGEDETGREIRAEIERLERAKQERERLEQERLEREQNEPEEAEFEGEEAEFVADDSARLRLGDEEERLPWLESDDDYADDSVDTKRIAMVAIGGLLAILAIVGVAWWLGRDTPDNALLAEGATIEAPDEPFRARPESPGGVAAEGTGDVSYEVGEGQDRPTQVAAATPVPTPSASASAAAAARPSIDRQQAAATPAPAASAAAATGGVGVQVGAYSTRATAEAGWNQLASQHSALAGVNHRIVQAMVDGNTVYRLQAVAGNTAGAETLCRAIKSGGGDCRVVN